MNQSRHFPRPLALVALGSAGLAYLAMGERLRLPFVPTEGFARGLWFGICLGADLLGVMLLFQARARPPG